VRLVIHEPSEAEADAEAGRNEVDTVLAATLPSQPGSGSDQRE
jgi:hypothetical protein